MKIAEEKISISEVRIEMNRQIASNRVEIFLKKCRVELRS